MTTDREFRARLLDLGGCLEAESDGLFAVATFSLGGLVFDLISEYGDWRLNVGVRGRSKYPASFWLAALAGRTDFPDPPVTDEDLERVIEHLPLLVKSASELEGRAEELGRAYSAAMRERFE